MAPGAGGARRSGRRPLARGMLLHPMHAGSRCAKHMPKSRTTARAAAVGATLLLSQALRAGPVTVSHREGLVHGFLALRTLAGETLASGDLLQTSRGEVVTSRLVFDFKDGSLHDETAVFRQNGRFRLLSYRLTQKGPSFPRTLDFTLDGRSGQARVRHVEGGGETKVEDDRLERVPLDLANGMVPTLLKNVRTEGGPMTFSMLAATPKPRLLKLVVTPTGEEAFTTPGVGRRAQHFVIKVDLGVVTGALASLLGKDPPDSHVWILTGAVPAFVKSEGALYVGGPIWRIELTSPSWPQGSLPTGTP